MGHTKSNKRCPARPLSEWEEKDASYELPTVEEGVTELVGTSLKMNLSKMNEQNQAKKTAKKQQKKQKAQKQKKEREKKQYQADDFDQDVHIINTSRAKKNPIINLNNILAEILSAVKQFDRVEPFRGAVDRVKWPSYYQLIKEPMDIGKIQEKIYATNVYKSRHDFLDDIRLMTNNALQFNGHQSQLFKDASDLRDLAIDELASRDDRLKESEIVLGTYNNDVIDKEKEIDLCFEAVERAR